LRQIVLLRGINLGPRNRIAMPALREALTAAGYGDVRTYVQSGNVVLSSDASPQDLEAAIEALIADASGLQIKVVVRTRDELADVVERNPLREVAVNPKRYLVSFLSHAPDTEAVERLAATTVGKERFAVHGRELYAWLPDGVGRSKLWTGLASGRLGVTATARNWTTVTALLELAS
jgi:uncharacterized protein (DUF1697 family)